MNKATTRPQRGWIKWLLIGLFFIFLLLLTLVYAWYLVFNPREVVETRYQNVPSNADFVCLVYDSPNGPQIMDWAIHKIVYDRMSPFNASMSDGQTIDVFTNEVYWTPNASKRVGVLCRTGPSSWHIYWFNTSKAQPAGRTIVFGGGAILFDFQNADQVRPVSQADQQRLGLTSIPYPFLP